MSFPSPWLATTSESALSSFRDWMILTDNRKCYKRDQHSLIAISINVRDIYLVHIPLQESWDNHPVRIAHVLGAVLLRPASRRLPWLKHQRRLQPPGPAQSCPLLWFHMHFSRMLRSLITVSYEAKVTEETHIHNCSLMVQFVFTQAVISSLSWTLVQIHVVFVTEQVDFSVILSIHSSYTRHSLASEDCKNKYLSLLTQHAGKVELWAAAKPAKEAAHSIETSGESFIFEEASGLVNVGKETKGVDGE